MRLYAMLAYVETEEWQERVMLGVFRDADTARTAFDQWAAGGGPDRLDPSGRMWDDGYTDYGYVAYQCDLDRPAEYDQVFERKTFPRIWPEDADD